MNPSQTLPANQPLAPLAADTMSAIEPTKGPASPVGAFHRHWREYLMESAELGLFMVSACFFTALLQHPASPARQFFPSSFLRMGLTGIAMGFTLLLLIHAPWGKRSGAHMNPATTLMFFRLGKLETWDALFYMFFQFIGGLAGAILSLLIPLQESNPHNQQRQQVHDGFVGLLFSAGFDSADSSCRLPGSIGPGSHGCGGNSKRMTR
jgi:Major intrinsic protein